MNFLFVTLDQIYAQSNPSYTTSDIYIDKITIAKKREEWTLRPYLVDRITTHLLANSFTWYITEPYTDNPNLALTLSWGYTWELIVSPVPKFSLLPYDTIIDNYIQEDESISYDINKKPFLLEESVWRWWSGIPLFRTKEDLEKLWYTVVSHRSRYNTDKSYRRHNIHTAFEEFGHTRIILPGEEISFIDDINYDPVEQELYQEWYVVVQDEEQPEYGGWLCWASTAMYQWLLTNTALEFPERRAHTKWYTDLYKASINGENIETPGIDSAIYDGYIDLKFTNTASYPVIMVSNYDGEHWWLEEVFTLALPSDEWAFEHLHTRPNKSTIVVDGKKVNVEGGCYVWEVNGEERKSCYKEVK